MSCLPVASPKGRASLSNPKNRFVAIEVESEVPGPKRVPTTYFEDSSRSIIARNNSPDVPFDASLNPYRGCEHGCAYCYARPTHEFLGFSAGLDFEIKILVKKDAPQLLRRELSSPRWRPQVLGLSGVTDPYQPIERKLEITRQCLDVLREFRNPVAIITKNALVKRDIDLLSDLAQHQAVAVFVSVTTLDGELVQRMEPRTSHPRQRFEALRALSQAGIPCGVLVAPVIPGLNDHEIPAILDQAAQAGARAAGYVLLRLPGAVAGLFEEWLEAHYPDRKDKILHLLRSSRDGQLNDPRFGKRMRGSGVFADHVRSLFHTSRRRHGLLERKLHLSTAAFRRPGAARQLALF